MAKVVGISGAQGGGKTSLLAELKTRGWTVDDFKVSRAVQAQLGWKSLDNVLKDPLTMMDFQEEVFRQKLNHDYALRDSDAPVVLVERTFADICAYTTHWTWELHYQGKMLLGLANSFLKKYVASCIQAQEECYAGVVLLPFMEGVVKWEDDPNRASRASVDQIYEGVERFTQHARFLTQKKMTIYTKSVHERAAQVELFMNTL